MKVKDLLEQTKLGMEMGYLTEESEIFFGIPGPDGFNVAVVSAVLPPLTLKERPIKKGVICFTNEMPLPKIDALSITVESAPTNS